MPIKRLPVVQGQVVSFREVQAQQTTIGRIRIGVFDPDKGNKGAPEKLDVFRLTSPQRDVIEGVAGLYGGTVTEYVPQNSTTRKEWEVITETKSLDVTIPPQSPSLWLEAWGSGGCVRRCDGDQETRSGEECLCAAGAVPPKDVCKPVGRVSLMLTDLPVLGLWRLESHGQIFIKELAGLAPYLKALPFNTFGLLYLAPERVKPTIVGRDGNPREVTSTVYVPRLVITGYTPRQLMAGRPEYAAQLGRTDPEALATGAEQPALTTGQAPQASASQAAPARSEPAPEPAKALPPVDTLLAAIEKRTTVADLLAYRDKMIAAGVSPKIPGYGAVGDALKSKLAALQAAEEAAKLAATKAHQDALRPDRATAEPVDAVVVEEAEGGAQTLADLGATMEAIAVARKTGSGPEGSDIGMATSAVYVECGKRGMTTARINELILSRTPVGKMSQLTDEHSAALFQLAAEIADGAVVV